MTSPASPAAPIAAILPSLTPMLVSASPPGVNTRPFLRMRRSEEHTSELQSLMRISYAVFCLKKKNKIIHINIITTNAQHDNTKYTTTTTQHQLFDILRRTQQKTKH